MERPFMNFIHDYDHFIATSLGAQRFLQSFKNSSGCHEQGAGTHENNVADDGSLLMSRVVLQNTCCL